MNINPTKILRQKGILILLSLPVFLGNCVKPDTGLRDAFTDRFLIGAALNPKQVLGKDTLAHAFILRHFNSITAENEMKWERIHPRPGEYDFTYADSLVSFGTRHGMSIAGHTLVWHSQTPDWVFSDSLGNPLTREALLERMKDHIYTVVGRYRGKVTGWDVVNEALEENGELRKSKWFEIIGEDYIRKAFEFANEADPGAELYYNDYNIEEPAKREGALKIIKSLQNAGVRIDGVGVQGHYLLNFPELSVIDSSFAAFAATGIKILVTELDVDILPFPWDKPVAEISRTSGWMDSLNPYRNTLPDSVQNMLTERYSDIFRVFVKHSNTITRVTFWGLNDGYSWKNNWPVPGRTNHPLLFDRQYQPKPAYEVVLKIAGGK